MTISSHSLLACKVSIEKSILSGKPFMCQITFSCFFQNSLFVFKSWQFHYNVSWSILFQLNLFGHFPSSWIWLFVSLPKFEIFLAIIYLDFLLLSLSFLTVISTTYISNDSLLRYFGKTETEPVGRICICLFNALLKNIQHSNITQTNFKYLMMKFHCENPINFIPIFLILIEVIAIKTFFSQLSDSFEWK